MFINILQIFTVVSWSSG